MDFDPDRDLVFYHKNGELMSGGFKIGGNILNETINAGMDENVQKGGSGGLNTILKDLAVPAGLFLLQQNYDKPKKYNYQNKEEEIDDTIYSKLLNLVEPSKKKLHSIKTKKKRDKKKKMTKKV